MAWTSMVSATIAKNPVILFPRQQRYVLLIISSWSSRASFIKKSLSSAFVDVKEVTSYLFVKGNRRFICKDWFGFHQCLKLHLYICLASLNMSTCSLVTFGFFLSIQNCLASSSFSINPSSIGFAIFSLFNSSFIVI